MKESDGMTQYHEISTKMTTMSLNTSNEYQIGLNGKAGGLGRSPGLAISANTSKRNIVARKRQITQTPSWKIYPQRDKIL